VEDPDLQKREEQLRHREIELRLRELELEVNRVAPPFYPTVKEQIDHKPARSFKRDLIIAAKFSGFFLAGIVIIYISQWLAWISFFALLGVAGWALVEFKRSS
jgi:hypothetical protein